MSDVPWTEVLLSAFAIVVALNALAVLVLAGVSRARAGAGSARLVPRQPVRYDVEASATRAGTAVATPSRGFAPKGSSSA